MVLAPPALVDGMGDEWAMHLGAGLILCCFGRYKQALSSLVFSQQLALRSNQKDQCRALCEAVGEICQSHETWRAHSFLIPHFQRYYSCSRSAQAWSALFVGWALINSKFGSYDDKVRWLKRSLDLAARSPDRDSLCYIECSANRLIFLITPEEEWQTILHHLRMWKEAGARWGNLEEEVWALHEYGTVCYNNDQHDEAVRSREQLSELVTNSSDALLHGISECLCGWIAYGFGRTEECRDYCMRVMSRLEVPRAAPVTSWSSYFGYSTTTAAPRNFKMSPSSPSRDKRFFLCLENALSVMVYACYRGGETEILIALAALAKYKQLMKAGGFYLNAHHMKLWHLEKLCGIHTHLFYEVKGQQWDSDGAESVLAKSLQLSHTRRAWNTYIETLKSMVWFAGLYLNTDHSDEGASPSRFKMIDSFLGEAERLARQHFPTYLSSLLYHRACFLFRMQKMAKAIKILESLGRVILERSYKLGSFSRDRILYSEWESEKFGMLQAALISCQQPDRALMWVERERAQDLLHSVRTNHSAPQVLELMEFNLDDENALEEIKSIATLAGDDTVFLVYTTLSHQPGICGVFLHHTVQHGWFKKLHRVNILASVHKTIRDFREDCNNLNRLQRWYKFLILPFEPLLEMIDPRKLVIVPGKLLAGLPFAALYKGPGEPFLIQKYAISYIPSLRMYSHCKRRGETLMESSRRELALVIGNPSKDLHHAEEEAIRTKDLLKRAGFKTVKLLQRDHATKSAVLESLPASDWIHYAGHAEVSNECPRGAMLLAPERSPSSTSVAEQCCEEDDLRSEGQTGENSRGMRLLSSLRGRPSSEVLTGDEIQTCGVEVRALVTVLSACQTGLGEVFSEGVLGLDRALHVVGAPSVLCSLWDLDDSSTMSIMGKLYEKLLARKELAIAFQEVVVDLINEDADVACLVSNWAAFIISGNPEMKLRDGP